MLANILTSAVARLLCKVLLRDPKADPDVEPRTHYSATQHTTDGKVAMLLRILILAPENRE